MGKMLDADQMCKVMFEQVRATCERVVKFADRNGIADLDEFVRSEMLGLGDEMIAQAATQVASQHRVPVPCPKCAGPMAFKQMREVTIRCVTTGKPIAVQSPYFKCGHCHIGRLTLRAALGINRDGLTGSLQHVARLATAMEPFETAAETVLKELAGIDLSGSKLHTVCQEAGDIAQELMDKGILGKARRLRPGERLYVEADGLMLWIGDGWHEVKLAVLFASSERADVSKARKLVTWRQYVVTLGDPDDLGKLLWQAVQQWLPVDRDGAPQVRAHVVFISDGAVWLKNMAETWLPGARVVLDFFHVAEHIAAAGRVLHPQDEVARKRWCKQQESLLLSGEVPVMLGGLLKFTKNSKLGQEVRDELQHLHKYLHERQASLCYLLQRAQGLDIGSGPAESAANHVLQQRMKRAGMRWQRDGAAAMAALRCAYRSTGGMPALRRQAA